MHVKVFGSTVFGVDAITITIEVNVYGGLHTHLVGLPDNAVKESILRIESALKTNGWQMPRNKVVVNLAPADIRKTGSSFDLPIAIGILAATGQLRSVGQLAQTMLMGELGLDGNILPIRGALPITMQAKSEGFAQILLPEANAREAGVVKEISVYGMRHLRDVVSFLHGDGENMFYPVETDVGALFLEADGRTDDFSEVKGQENIKRALEIAAAGGHNALLIGPPGAGKTMLAKRLPGILPPMRMAEALETTRIHSVAGRLNRNKALVTARPFRSPHHSISASALAGGGSIPQPGEISLAHNGVLFLDELPEYKRSVLEVMRQPMEERKITVSRARLSSVFPASFMLIASMNPCPCGYFNHPDKECKCHPSMVQKYLQKISGPLLDRIDLHVEVTPVSFSDLQSERQTESSETVRARVVAARKQQELRFAAHQGIFCNAQMPANLLTDACTLPGEARTLLQQAMEKLQLSARAYDRILKVARTIADLAGKERIAVDHLAEAIQYRSLDRENWGK
ncbi:MAG: YifB family Mg chelatase-like AAA ATPase [Chitinophagaceae bacterium]